MAVNIKSTSNAIWWIKNPTKAAKTNAPWLRKESLGSSFCLDMADLLRNISLHGYNKLLAPKLSLWEKLIWVLVHATTFVALVVTLSLTWEQFVSQYFAIQLKDPLYPVENVPFPAVSICSNNRISLQAATTYARYLQERDPQRRNISYYLENLKMLTDFYTISNGINDREVYEDFQAFLDLFGTFDNETFFNTRRIVEMLTPKCEDMLLKCFVAGNEIPCMNATAFQANMTIFGPCCTFNVFNSYKQRNYKNRLSNPELGLTVVLNASKEDYLAPILNTNGYIVLIHNPDNFATETSSNAREIFPPQNEETALSIRARVVDTDIALKSFSPFSRKCYFIDEVPQPKLLLRSTYTFPNCITSCRMKSVMALCRCLPFSNPLELLENLDGVVYCTLNDLACISRYRFKWWHVLTNRQVMPGLEREIEEGLYCPQCLPSCDDVLYEVSSSSLPIDGYLNSMNIGDVNNTLTSSDISVLRVYFGEVSAQFYIRLLNNTWFEVLSTVGNILSIFIGFSLVAILEIFFFLLKYILAGVDSIIRQHNAANHRKDVERRKELLICP